MVQTAEEFWNSQYSLRSAPDVPAIIRRAVVDAIDFFGDMRGKQVLDIGCGTGGTSLLLAETGAQVTSLDFSRTAVDSLNGYVSDHGIQNLTAVCGDALKIDRLGKFDFVFGSLILHHIEPFGQFCGALRQSLNHGGRAFFLENNAASDLLIWFRTHIVGRLWVPRCGDGIEFPLTLAEVAQLRSHFSVEIKVPEMIFFQLASIYLLKRKFISFTKSIDELLFRYNLGKKYSYRQYLMVRG